MKYGLTLLTPGSKGLLMLLGWLFLHQKSLIFFVHHFLALTTHLSLALLCSHARTTERLLKLPLQASSQTNRPEILPASLLSTAFPHPS